MNSEMITKEVTLDALNQLTGGQIVLMTLRILNTSDLVFMFNILMPESVTDVIESCKCILDIEADETLLTLEQKTEILGYISNMEPSCARIK